MNPTLLLLLAGGAAVVAVAASKSSPPTSESLVDSSKTMVRVFELYTKPMYQLTNEELVELGTINGQSKGFAFEPWPTNPSYDYDWYNYYRKFFLPAGVSTSKGPDFFTGWTSTPFPDRHSKNAFAPLYEPWIECTETQGQRYDQGSTVTGVVATRADDCYRGILRDFFWREVGSFEGDESYGKSEFMQLVDGISNGLKDVWSVAGSDILKTTADVASNFPGIGSVVAAGASFLEAIGSGESITNASLAAARGAVPSTMRAAYDLGVGLATQGHLDIESAMTVAMAAAIKYGVVSGDILDKYNTIRQAYDDAKSAGVEVKDNLTHLGTIANVAAEAGNH